jgi:hypothetical protein
MLGENETTIYKKEKNYSHIFIAYLETLSYYITKMFVGLLHYLFLTNLWCTWA